MFQKFVEVRLVTQRHEKDRKKRTRVDRNIARKKERRALRSFKVSLTLSFGGDGKFLNQKCKKAVEVEVALCCCAKRFIVSSWEVGKNTKRTNPAVSDDCLHVSELMRR